MIDDKDYDPGDFEKPSEEPERGPEVDEVNEDDETRLPEDVDDVDQNMFPSAP